MSFRTKEINSIQLLIGGHFAWPINHNKNRMGKGSSHGRPAFAEGVELIETTGQPLETRKQSSLEKRSMIEKPNEFIEFPLSCNRILREIGEFGLYQILVGLTTGAALCFSGFSAFSFIFASNVPPHRF